MTDITSRDLRAALLDQKVAGHFNGKAYAYVAIIDGDGWSLGVAEANERGYTPVGGFAFITEKAAQDFCNEMNAHIGVDRDKATRIIVSTMGGRAYREART